MRTTDPKYRLVGSLIFVGLLVGCAVAPIVPNADLATSPTEAPSPGLTVAPSVMPSAGEVAPCNPRTASMAIVDAPWWGQRARDWVLLGLCESRYIQRVRQSPAPLRLRVEDFGLAWLAPDASYALGLRHATPTAQDVQQQLIKRFTDGRPDQLLSTEIVNQLWVAPDGATIAFLTQGAPVGDPPEPTSHLSLFRVETGEVRQVATSVSVMSTWTQWSPDGTRLLIHQRHPEALNGDPWSVDRPLFSLAWTSWNDPTLHRMPGNAAMRYDLHRGMMSWAPDSRHVLIYDQNAMIPNSQANLVTLDFAGKETLFPIVGPEGKALTDFVPLDIAPGNRMLVGYNGFLDAETGRFAPHTIEGVLRWSLEPGKLLRWRPASDGLVLDTVSPDGVGR